MSGHMKVTEMRPARRISLRTLAPALAAVGTLGVGFADLARGGTTLSALLLVIGYVAVVPWAILTTGRTADTR